MQYGYGKLILFGEHFVVYGLPAIASAIDLYTRAQVFPHKNGVKMDDLLMGKHLVFGEHPEDVLDRTMRVILKETKLTGKSFGVKADGNIPTFGGLGSSASIVVAMTKELNAHFSLGLSDERVNEIAFEAEKVFHGNPSGIDNTVSTFGGLVWFEKNLAGGKNRIEKLKLKKPLLVVIGNTKVSRDTGTVVREVRERKEKEPQKYRKIFAQAKDLVFEAREKLLAGKEKEIGELINQNHKLLQEIKVNSKELDLLCRLALDAGALGAKLTGAGKGGCMYALAKDKKSQEQIKKAFEKEGFDGYITSVGVKA